MLTTVMLAKTLAKKWSSAFLVRFDRSSAICAPSTKASMRRGKAAISIGSAEGYGTGAGHDPHLDSTG